MSCVFKCIKKAGQRGQRCFEFYPQICDNIQHKKQRWSLLTTTVLGFVAILEDCLKQGTRFRTASCKARPQQGCSSCLGIHTSAPFLRLCSPETLPAGQHNYTSAHSAGFLVLFNPSETTHQPPFATAVPRLQDSRLCSAT